MNILVTGSAGFIGSHVVRMLVEAGCKVVGIDNLEPYYNTRLKLERLRWCGIAVNAEIDGENVTSDGRYWFYNKDICNYEEISTVIRDHEIRVVFHLAAQAGVRYSLKVPLRYVRSNMLGFAAVIEAARENKVSDIIYASSSSVYGDNSVVPYSEDLPVNKPLSVYAATKRSNELYAYAVSSLGGISMTGVRFFTVYGPWGRPDMAYYLFADKIMNGETIQLRGEGNMKRDHTYIGDVVEGLWRIYDRSLNEEGASLRHDGVNAIYNIGYGQPISTYHIVRTLEALLGKKAIVEYVEEKQGEPLQTYADPSKMQKIYDFLPRTDFEVGMKIFAEWYLHYKHGHEVQERAR